MIVREVLLNRDGPSGRIEPELLAEYWMQGEDLFVRYANPAAAMIVGEISTATGALTPTDGRAFFDALPAAFSVSSTISVRDNDRAEG